MDQLGSWQKKNWRTQTEQLSCMVYDTETIYKGVGRVRELKGVVKCLADNNSREL